LSADDDLARLRDASSSWLDLSQRQVSERPKEQDRLNRSKALAEMSRAEVNSYYSEPDGLLTKKGQRGLEELQRLSLLALKESDAARKANLINLIGEVGEALNNNHRAPIPAAIDVAELPFVHYDYTHNPIANGEDAAWNLEPRPTDAHVDSSRLNPKPSTFWTCPTNIAALNLFDGFGRSERPQIRAIRHPARQTGIGVLHETHETLTIPASLAQWRLFIECTGQWKEPRQAGFQAGQSRGWTAASFSVLRIRLRANLAGLRTGPTPNADPSVGLTKSATGEQGEV